MNIPANVRINRKISKSTSMEHNENRLKRSQDEANIYFDEDHDTMHPISPDDHDASQNPYILFYNRNQQTNNICADINNATNDDDDDDDDDDGDDDDDYNVDDYDDDDDDDDSVNDDDSVILIENNFYEVGSDKFYEADDEIKLIDIGNFNFLEEKFFPWFNQMENMSHSASDKDVILFRGSRFTKTDLAQDIHDFLQRQGETNKLGRLKTERDLMVNIILKYFPEDSNLPMAFKCDKNNLYISMINEYVEDNPFEDRTSFIDVCSNASNCVAFVGDYADLNRCPTCNRERYHKCTRPKCAKKSYDECNCDYSTTQRNGKKQLPYRSIIQLFIYLLEFEFFVQMCNTVMAKIYVDSMTDVKNGFTYKKHLTEMKGNFERWKKDEPEKSVNCKSVTLMLSLFYDGVKVYNWKHSYFWPLIVSILNLPPSYRSKFCVGQFIVGLLTLSQGKAGESVLLQCLIQELQVLEKGIFITNKQGQRYYLQVRLVQYLLDTPAAAKFFNYEGHGSLAGCVYCGRICGKTLPDSNNKTAYLGHRFLLPLDHYLRIFGQTGTCCPKRFYPARLIENNLDRDDKITEFKVHALQFYEQNEDNDVVQLKKSAFEGMNGGLCVDSIEHSNDIEKFVRDNTSGRPFSWFSHYDKQLFDNYLYFLHCDLRPTPKPYNLYKRNLIFKQLGSLANDTEDHIQGVKSKPIMAQLSYFNFQEQFCPVNCHVIANNVSEYFRNVKGTNDMKGIAVSKKTKSFPWLYTSNKVGDKLVPSTIPWNLTNDNMHLLDAHINCIIVPFGYSQDFQVNNPFQQTDVLNMKGKFHIASTLMELIIHWSFAPFDLAYKVFYLMFSKTLQQLLRPNKRKDDESLSILEQTVNQVASLHEGLFPLTSQNKINHQYTDLLFGIRIFGTLKGFNSFSGERAGGIFKRMLRKGGVANEVSIMNKYDKLEFKMIKTVYSQKLSTLFDQHTPLLSALNQHAFMDNFDPHFVHFTEHRVCLYDEAKTKQLHFITDTEIYALLESLYVYILNKLRIQGFHGDDKECKGTYDSALFRVYYWFYGYRNSHHKASTREIEFKDVFEDLNSITHNFEVSNAQIMETIYRKYKIVIKRSFPNKDKYQMPDWNDILLIRKLIMHLQATRIFKNAEIYGERFHGRNDANDNELATGWWYRENISSWAKFSDHLEIFDDDNHASVGGRRTLNSSDKYMNINYFFRINFKEEIHLDGMAIANGTSRHSYKSKAIPDEQWRKPTGSKELPLSSPAPSEEVDFLEHIVVGAENKSLHKRSIFVPCVYIFATKVMIIPYFDRNFDYSILSVGMPSKSFRALVINAKPYLLDNKSLSIPEETKKHYAKCNNNDINFLTMIDMHPEKALDYSYNDLLNDDTYFIKRFLFNKKCDRP